MPSQKRRLSGGVKARNDSISNERSAFGWSQAPVSTKESYPYRPRNCWECPLGASGYNEPPDVISGKSAYDKIHAETGLSVREIDADQQSAVEIVQGVLGIDGVNSSRVIECLSKIASTRTLSMFNQDPQGCGDYYLPDATGAVIWDKE